MKHPVIIICFLLMAAGATAQLAVQESMVEKANQSYSAEDYASAVSEYESVIGAGYESAGLYFNLGNAYFKLNNIPAAILYYEKARKMDPTDENTRFNLDLANSRIIDKMDPVPEFFLKTWVKSARDIFPSDLWAKITVVAFIFVLLLLALFIISVTVSMRKISFWAALVLFIFMSVSLLFSVSSHREYSRHSSGIIFTPTVTVKSSPNESSVDLFVIHEGTKVFVTDQVEGWSEVRLANGNVGWVKTETFRYI